MVPLAPKLILNEPYDHCNRHGKVEASFTHPFTQERPHNCEQKKSQLLQFVAKKHHIQMRPERTYNISMIFNHFLIQISDNNLT